MESKHINEYGSDYDQTVKESQLGINDEAGSSRFVNVFKKQQAMARYKTDSKKDQEMNGPGTLLEFMPNSKKSKSDQLKDANCKIISMH